MENSLSSIFASSFIPSLAAKSAGSPQSISSSKNENVQNSDVQQHQQQKGQQDLNGAPRVGPPPPPSMDPMANAIFEKLLCKIEQLEAKIDNMKGNPRGDAEIFPATDSVTSASSSSIADVSMRYRVLSPPSSITGTATFAQDASTNDIDVLQSKVDLNAEMFERLSTIVSTQESALSHHRDLINRLLTTPDLTASASVLIQKVWRGWRSRMRFFVEHAKSRRIQSWFRKSYHHHDYQRRRSSAILIQKNFKRALSRQPERIRSLYLENLELRKEINGLIPQPNICPITHEVIEDEMTCLVDGHVYEKSAILHWATTNKTSPMTREEIALSDLIPSKNLISAFNKAKQQLAAAVTELNMAKRIKAGMEEKGKITSIEIADLNNQKKIREDEKREMTSTLSDKKQALASERVRADGLEIEARDLKVRLEESANMVSDYKRERDRLLIQLAGVSVRVEQAEAEAEGGGKGGEVEANDPTSCADISNKNENDCRGGGNAVQENLTTIQSRTLPPQNSNRSELEDMTWETMPVSRSAGGNPVLFENLSRSVLEGECWRGGGENEDREKGKHSVYKQV